jgi:hypothetical protein
MLGINNMAVGQVYSCMAWHGCVRAWGGGGHHPHATEVLRMLSGLDFEFEITDSCRNKKL